MILKAHSLRNAPTHFLRKRVSTTSQVEIYDFFLMNSVLRPLMKLFALITLLIKIEIFMLCIVPIYVFAFVIGICSCHLGGEYQFSYVYQVASGQFGIWHVLPISVVVLTALIVYTRLQ